MAREAYEDGKFVKPERTGVGLSAKGNLVIFRPGRIVVLKARPLPAAFEKTYRNPKWRHTRGKGAISFKEAYEEASRYASFEKKNGPRRIDIRGFIERLVEALERNEEFTSSSPPPLRQGKRINGPRTAYEKQAGHAYSRFVTQIPGEFKQELSKYHRDRAWHMFTVFARCPGAFELAAAEHGCRALVFMLASLWVFRKPAVQRPLRSVRALLGKKRTEILKYLMFPKWGRSVVRILARIEPGSLNLMTLLYLRDALARDHVHKRLCHLGPRLNRDVLCLLTNPHLEPMISQKLAEEVTTTGFGRNRVFDFIRMLRDTLQMLMEVRGTCRPVFGSTAEVYEIHDELSRRFYGCRPNKDVRFPMPPLLGTQDIQPILSSRELWFEGEEQRNCVASPHYARMAAEGSMFFYRMINPERCTLALVRSPHPPGFRIHDFRAINNEPPKRAAREHVDAWMSRYDPVWPPAVESTEEQMKLAIMQFEECFR